MENTLVLVRHGESEWNRLNLFARLARPGPDRDKGVNRRPPGRFLKAKGLLFDIAYTSALRRAQRLARPDPRRTRPGGHCHRARQGAQRTRLRPFPASTRTMRASAGASSRCSFGAAASDIAPPGLESLKDTATRVLPYYKTHIWPDVKAGRDVLVVAHGTSIRALIMYLEELTASRSWSARSPACRSSTG